MWNFFRAFAKSYRLKRFRTPLRDKKRMKGMLNEQGLVSTLEARREPAGRYRRWRMPAAMAALAMLAIGLRATPAHALTACLSKSIAACCKINQPGIYNVTSSLQAPGGDCIDITVPGVFLNLQNNPIAQLGPNGTGIGIHVLSTAPGTIVNGGANIKLSSQGVIIDFQTGVQNDAPGAFIYAFEAENNVTGVVDNASNATFFAFLADTNTGNGVTVNSPRRRPRRRRTCGCLPLTPPSMALKEWRSRLPAPYWSTLLSLPTARTE
jgi:hypothetical protein